MTEWILVASLWAGLIVFGLTYQFDAWLMNRNKPPEDWPWAENDYSKNIYWVRSLGEYAPQVSEPTSAADSPSE